MVPVLLLLVVGGLVWPLIDERIAKVAVVAIVLMFSVFALLMGWPERL